MSNDRPVSALPYRQQIAEIEALIRAPEGEQRERDLAELISALGAQGDPAPLAETVERLARTEPPESLAALIEPALRGASDLHLREVLRVLPESRSAAQAVCRAMSSMPVERLAALCLLDRWLKRAARDLREDLCERAAQALDAAIAAPGGLDALDDATIAVIDARRLQERARGGSQGPLSDRLSRYASRVLRALEIAPKSLSQAGAEELLSKRIYVDRGHFLFELLQNAEDAAARRFRVVFRPGEIEVRHDGRPFDARDVVGVLSIGQTTKGEGQIGKFGVGFKSIYAVTERPQIASGPFRFEIASISIPRALLGPPSEETTLVLPLRADVDEEEIWRFARDIPQEILLTLSSLAEIEISRGEERITLTRTAGERAHTVQITATSRGERSETSFLTVASRQPLPEERPRAAVRVAVRIEGGACAGLRQGAPTVYAFLPTRLRSGLRLLIHAPFDLPVDRERLTEGSPYNALAIARAGSLLAEIARVLPEGPERSSVLSVLPLPRELSHEISPLFDALREGLAELPLLPGAGGTLLVPGRAALAEDPSLVPVLAGVPLDEAGRELLSALPPRERALASALGAVPFGPDELEELLVRSLSAQGQIREGSWLRPGLLPALRSLRRSGRAAAVPLPDGAWSLRPPSEIARADRATREVYGEARPLLHPELDTPGDELLWEAIGVRLLGESDLVEDLSVPALRQAILAHAGVDALLSLLSSRPLPGPLLGALASLPLLPDRRGQMRPVVGPERAVQPCEGAFGAWLVEHGPVPLVDAAVAERHGPLLARLGLQVLSLADALPLLADLSPGALSALHGALEADSGDLTRRLCDLLARMPLFLDSSGARGPCVGAGRVLLAAEPDLPDLLPELRWMSPDLAGRAHLRAIVPAPTGPAELARGLLEGSPEEGFTIDLLYRTLTARPSAMAAPLRRALASAPIWRDLDGVPRPLGQIGAPPADPDLAALFSLARAPQADPTALAAVRALDLSPQMADRSHGALVDALISGALPASLPDRGPLLRALSRAAEILPPERLRALGQAALFASEDGAVMAMRAPSSPGGLIRPSAASRSALRALGLPLLSPGDEATLGRLLSAIGIAPAGASVIVEEIAGRLDAGLPIEPIAADTARAALAALARQGERVGPAALLARLPLWPAQDGRLRPADEIVRRPQSLDRALGPGWSADPGWLQGAGLLDPGAEGDADALEGLVRFCSPLSRLAERVKAEAKPGAPLADQTPLLGATERLLGLLGAARDLLPPEAIAELPLCLDARGRLAAGPLLSASGDAAALASGAPIEGLLAEPSFARAGREIVASLFPPLPPRRLLLSLSAGGALADSERRAILYRWLLSEADAIASDPEARGILAKWPCIASRSGRPLPPRELLVGVSEGDFGEEVLGEEVLGACPAEEVPAALVSWLDVVYSLRQSQIPALTQRILSLHDDACKARDLDAVYRSLCALAALLAGAPSSGRPGLHRRLQVEAEGGRLTWPRKLLAPDPMTRSRLSLFCEPMPAIVSARYDSPALLVLIREAGAEADLPAEDLSARMMDPSQRKPGLQAAIALADYVVERMSREPELARALPVARAPWVPSGSGQPAAPERLYRPSPALVMLIGDDPALYPHPGWLTALPPDRASALPLRAAPLLADVLAEAERSGGLSPAQLAFLEQGLAAKDFDAAALRRECGARPLFRDERGAPHPRSALSRPQDAALFGARARTLQGADRLPRLHAALGIEPPSAPRILEHLEAIAAEIVKDARGTLAAELTLADTLPRCLARLAVLSPTAGADPSRIAIAASDRSGQIVLCVASEPRLSFSPIDTDRDPLVPVVSDAASRALLVRWGVREGSPREEVPGLFQRVRRLLRPAERRVEPKVASPEPTPPRIEEPPRPPRRPPAKEPARQRSPQSDARWMREQSGIDPQLDAATDWLEDRGRAPEYGFSFSPESLPFPWLYAPKFVGVRFDGYLQRWVSGRVDPAWSRPALGERQRVDLVGRVPEGEVQPPVPLYAEIDGIEGEGVALVQSREGRPLLRVSSERDLTLRIACGPAPDLSSPAYAAVPPRVLLERTVPDEELPDELHEALSGLGPEDSPLRRAQILRDLVRERYQYDGAVLEDPDYAAAMRRRIEGKHNRTVALLHARRDERWLGKGVCFELGVLMVELLRRASVPAAVCTGWTFDRGTVSEPDHLWALALLPSPEGLRWLPVDASSTASGRPLHTGPRPKGPWVAPRRERLSLDAGALEDKRPSRRRWDQKPDLAERLAQVLAEIAGEEPLAQLDARCRRLLDDPEERARLLSMFRDR